MLIALCTLAVAASGPWKPVWSGLVDDLGAMPQVELLGVDEAGDTAWIRVGNGPRSTRALWQIDLERGRPTGVWASDEGGSQSFGALAPLVDAPGDLARFGLLQAHVAGRPTWPALSVDPLGQWLAWEHGDRQGQDAVTLVGLHGPQALGEADLVAVYRPRFHPDAPLVAYTGATARGDYRVVVEDLAQGRRVRVDGVQHGAQLDWDAHGSLWVTGDGCVARLRAAELAAVLHDVDAIGGSDGPRPMAEAVACGMEELSTRVSPDGLTVLVTEQSADHPGTLLARRFRTENLTLIGKARVPGGRSVQALRDDGWMLVTTLEGSAMVPVDDRERAAVPFTLTALGAVHDHWPDGRALALSWDPRTRIATLGWVSPPEM